MSAEGIVTVFSETTKTQETTPLKNDIYSTLVSESGDQTKKLRGVWTELFINATEVWQHLWAAVSPPILSLTVIRDT